MTYPDDLLTQEERDAIKSVMDEPKPAKETNTQAPDSEFPGLTNDEDEDESHE
jgi:hypothetical protein